MENMSLSFGLIQDLTLILISGLACLYCWLLNKRLKKLNNLESGVGATIVSLTNVIQDTHVAAKSTLDEITQNMNTLRHLIEKAEGQAVQLEAFSIELERDVKKAEASRAELKSVVDNELPESLKSAHATAQTLLQSVKAAKTVSAKIKTGNKSEAKPVSEKKTSAKPDVKTGIKSDAEADIKEIKLPRSSAMVKTKETKCHTGPKIVWSKSYALVQTA